MRLETADNFAAGYVAGDSLLHKLSSEVKIIASLFLLLGSGVGSHELLAVAGFITMASVLVAKVPVNKIIYFIRRMAWFFLAISIFPILFTPGFYIDLPFWLPFKISHEGLILGLESSLRLVIVLLISLILARTTSSSDWMKGMEKLLSPMICRFQVVRELLEVAVLSVRFLPQVIANAEDHFSDLHKNEVLVEKKSLVQKIRSICNAILPFIVSIFSNIDHFKSPIVNNTQR